MQLTPREDAAFARVQRGSFVPQLDMLADVDSMKKTGGVGARVADYLEGARPIQRTRTSIGKLRCLFAEAAHAPERKSMIGSTWLRAGSLLETLCLSVHVRSTLQKLIQLRKSRPQEWGHRSHSAGRLAPHGRLCVGCEQNATTL